MANENSVSFDGIVVNALGSLIATGMITLVGIGGSGEFSLIKVLGVAVLIFLTSVVAQSATELTRTDRVALTVTSLYVLGVLSVAWLASESVVFGDSVSLFVYFSFVTGGLLLSTRVFRKSYRTTS